MAPVSKMALLVLSLASAVDGHLLRAAPAANATSSSAVIEEPRVPSALENVGSPKKCRFHDVCDCSAAMEFMDCISGACHGGRHDCHELEYHRACVNMAHTCQKLDFECSNRRAVCTITVNMTDPERAAAMARRTDEELREELRQLQKEKCAHEHAMMHHDLLNADNELAKLAPKVQRRIQELQSRDAEDIPSFACDDGVPEKPASKVNLKSVATKQPKDTSENDAKPAKVSAKVTAPKVEPVSAGKATAEH